MPPIRRFVSAFDDLLAFMLARRPLVEPPYMSIVRACAFMQLELSHTVYKVVLHCVFLNELSVVPIY